MKNDPNMSNEDIYWKIIYIYLIHSAKDKSSAINSQCVKLLNVSLKSSQK